MRAAGLSICGAFAALAACLSLSPAAAAAELEPGVHVDPGSPAAKEYVLPLSQARQTGGGSSTKGGNSSLFGAGITPPSGGSGGGSAGGRSSRAGSRTNTSAPLARPGAAAPAPAPLPADVLRTARSPNSSAGSGSLLALLGGGLAVLVLGAFGGTVLRHSRRPHGRRPTTSG